MEKRGLNVFLIFFVLSLLLIGFLFIRNTGIQDNSQVKQSSESGECAVDGDCVPSTCCHANGCVAKNKAPICSGVSCTEECAAGSLDCEQGKCGCVNKRCKAVFQ